MDSNDRKCKQRKYAKRVIVVVIELVCECCECDFIAAYSIVYALNPTGKKTKN